MCEKKKIYVNYFTEVECCEREYFEPLPDIRLMKGDIVVSHNGIKMEVLWIEYASGRTMTAHLGIPKHLGVSEKEFGEMVREKRKGK
jgi:hypothetical protein